MIAGRLTRSRVASIGRVGVVVIALISGGSHALGGPLEPDSAIAPSASGDAGPGTVTPTPAVGPPAEPSGPSPDASPLPTLTPLQTATPLPTPTPKVVRFGPGTAREFLAVVRDKSVDVIEIEAGTYRNWHVYIDVDRVRPLLVRPAPGAAVIWDGSTSRSGDGLFYFGYRALTSNITFDPAGTGGTFTIQNYDLGQQGLIDTFWVDQVALNGFRTKGISGLQGGSLSWTVYVSSDGLHRGRNITVNDWRVAASAGRTVGGLQTYHNPQAAGIRAYQWQINAASSAMTLYGDATGIDIQDWLISNCDYAVVSDGNAAGVLRNNTSTGSTSPPVIRGSLVNGTGNSWN
jgi:hypothetical protein